MYNYQQIIEINYIDKGIDHRSTFLFCFLLKITVAAKAFRLRNNTHNCCHLAVLIPKSIRP